MELVVISTWVAGAVSLAMCNLMLRFQPEIEQRMQPRNDLEAVQNSHVGKPLRLGGIAVLSGIGLAVAILCWYSGRTYTIWLLLSAAPVFLAGILEDLGYLVSPRGRFLASIVSATIATFALGLWVPGADLPFLDDAMAFAGFAIPVTILFAVCCCHALNLIDGMNGLASLTISAAAIGLFFISNAVELTQIAAMSALLAAGAVGFMFFNWPRGRIFLGDAGAYTLGHMLVWLAISIAALAPEVTVPALLLVLFWPLADVLHTVLRRALNNLPIFHPDRMHLHQKIRRSLEIAVLGQRSKAVSNPVTTLLMAPFIVAPVVTGALLHDQKQLAWVAFAVFLALFAGTNLLIIHVARRHRQQAAPRPTAPDLRMPERDIKADHELPLESAQSSQS